MNIFSRSNEFFAGYGKSRPPDKKFSTRFFQEDAEIALRLMEQLGPKPYSLLGWSDGGITAMMMAGMEPEAIDKLVIWGSNAYIIPDELKTYESNKFMINFFSIF